MFDTDPTFDGASLMTVGGTLLAAARERPTFGLALARDRDEHPGAPTRGWFVGTRFAADAAAHDPLRFEGGAPPLAALARRVDAGEFGTWFAEVKEGVDTGALQPLRPRGEGEAETAVVASVTPPAPDLDAQPTMRADRVETVVHDPSIARMEFEPATELSYLRSRARRG